jgi:S1-C subfamily serine protease
MGRRLASIALAGLLAAPVYSHRLDELIADAKVEMGKSTYLLRKTTIYATPVLSNGKVMEHFERDVRLGTASVYSEEKVRGRTEYLLLTNNHVASPKHIVGSRVHEVRLELLRSQEDTDPIILERINTDPDHDAALVRTVHAQRQLHVDAYTYRGPPRVGTTVVSSGHPHGAQKATVTGTVTDLADRIVDVTPSPHDSYRVSMFTVPGQSGSKALGILDGEISFIGMIFAKLTTSDEVGFITPYETFRRMVEERKSIPSKRPQLYAPVTGKSLSRLPDKLEVSIDSYSYALQNIRNGVILTHTSAFEPTSKITMTLGIEKNKLIVKRIEGRGRSVRPTGGLSASIASGVINYMLLDQELRAAEEKSQQQYYRRIMEEDEELLSYDLLAYYSVLYTQGVATDEFLGKVEEPVTISPAPCPSPLSPQKSVVNLR